MAVSYGAIGTTGATTGTTSVTASYPSGIAALTSKLYLIVTGRSNTASTSAAVTGGGWAQVGAFEGGTGTWAVDAGTRRVEVWKKDTVTGLETGSITVTLAGTSANTLYARIVRVEVTSGYGITEQFVSGDDTTSGTAFSATGGSALFSTGDLLLLGHAGCVDTATLTSQAISASGVTFGTFSNRSTIACTGGNDHRHAVQTAPVSTGSGTPAAPTFTYTASASTSGAVGFAILTEVGPLDPPEVIGPTYEFRDLGTSATPSAASIDVPSDALGVAVHITASSDGVSPVNVTGLTGDFCDTFIRDDLPGALTGLYGTVAYARVTSTGTGKTLTATFGGANTLAGASAFIYFLKAIDPDDFVYGTDSAGTPDGTTAATGSVPGVASGLVMALDTRIDLTNAAVYPTNQSGFTSEATDLTTQTYTSASRLRSVTTPSTGTNTATTQDTFGSMVTVISFKGLPPTAGNSQAIAFTLDGVTVAVDQTATHPQSLAATLDGVTIAIAQTATHAQSLAASLDGVTVAVSQVFTRSQALAATLDGVTVAINQASQHPQSLAITLDDVDVDINQSIGAGNSQAIAFTLDNVVAAIAQTATHSQSLAATLDGVTVAIAQTAQHPQALAITLDGISVAINQGLSHSQALAITLDGVAVEIQQNASPAAKDQALAITLDDVVVLINQSGPTDPQVGFFWPPALYEQEETEEEKRRKAEKAELERLNQERIDRILNGESETLPIAELKPVKRVPKTKKERVNYANPDKDAFIQALADMRQSEEDEVIMQLIAELL